MWTSLHQSHHDIWWVPRKEPTSKKINGLYFTIISRRMKWGSWCWISTFKLSCNPQKIVLPSLLNFIERTTLAWKLRTATIKKLVIWLQIMCFVSSFHREIPDIWWWQEIDDEKPYRLKVFSAVLHSAKKKLKKNSRKTQENCAYIQEKENQDRKWTVALDSSALTVLCHYLVCNSVQNGQKSSYQYTYFRVPTVYRRIKKLHTNIPILQNLNLRSCFTNK